MSGKCDEKCDKMLAMRRKDSEVVVQEDRGFDEFDRRVITLQEHSKKSVKIINALFIDKEEVVFYKEESSISSSKLDLSLSELDVTIRKAAELSFQFESFKEEELKKNKNSLIRTIDPFGDLPHIDHIHGNCRTIVGGSMHVFYQLLISIEKAILLPVTLSHLPFKLLLDSYGKVFIDLSDFEDEFRGISYLRKMSSKRSGTIASFREVVLQEFNDLMVFSIGVPSFFQFSLRQNFMCITCRSISKRCNVVRKHFLEVKICCLVRTTSISELLR
jgi:hypothetical protein